MEVEVERVGEVSVIRPAGRMDARSSTKLQETLEVRLGEGDRWLAMDLERVEHMAGAPLRVLLMIRAKLEASAGALVLCGLSPHVVRALGVAGVADRFETEATAAEAIVRLERNQAIVRLADRVVDLMSEADSRDEEAQAEAC